MWGFKSPLHTYKAAGGRGSLLWDLDPLLSCAMPLSIGSRRNRWRFPLPEPSTIIYEVLPHRLLQDWESSFRVVSSPAGRGREHE